MQILILVLFSLVLVTGFLVGYKFFKTNACYVVGIGAIVSANVYNIGSFSFVAGGMTFGIDSIVYTICLFCIVLLLTEEGKKEAMKLTYTYMASLFLTALTDFTIKLAVTGLGQEMVWGFYSYLVSIVATYVAVRIAVWIYDLTNEKLPLVLDFTVFIAIASFVNSIIYFGAMTTLFGGNFNAFLLTLSGSYIGKLFTLLVFVGTYLLFRKKLNLKKVRAKVLKTNSNEKLIKHEEE